MSGWLALLQSMNIVLACFRNIQWLKTSCRSTQTMAGLEARNIKSPCASKLNIFMFYFLISESKGALCNMNTFSNYRGIFVEALCSGLRAKLKTFSAFFCHKDFFVAFILCYQHCITILRTQSGL